MKDINNINNALAYVSTYAKRKKGKTMNIKVIKKNKKVFDAWLNGELVWYKRNKKNLDWTLRSDLNWTNTSGIYIKHDEYAELKKALFDGKIIEKYFDKTWFTIAEPRFEAPANMYRIKPEEKWTKTVTLYDDETGIHYVTSSQIINAEVAKSIVRSVGINI